MAVAVGKKDGGISFGSKNMNVESGIGAPAMKSNSFP